MGFTAGMMMVAGGAMNATSQYQAGKAQSQIAGYNARVAEAQAVDAIERGELEESRQRSSTQQLIGSQRARLAAQGIEIDSGSALEVQEDTAALGEMDALMIRNNAAREAWGYRTQAADYRNQGTIAKAQGTSQAIGTILGTAGNVYRGGYFKG